MNHNDVTKQLNALHLRKMDALLSLSNLRDSVSALRSEYQGSLNPLPSKAVRVQLKSLVCSMNAVIKMLDDIEFSLTQKA